ncbi:DUF975 family protein [Eubacteriales bacterium OttesenSCG-928-A19]|nr:DUF975 family protein [Eubacteriales bacterium OttesenSCG-928-A19]
MNDRATIKARAKDTLNRYWGPCIGVLVLYTIINAVVAVPSMGIGTLFLMPPLTVGMTMFFLGVWRRHQPAFETMFNGFHRYTQSLIGILWMDLWIFLWSLLLVIPGIYKSLAYSMTPYLIADNPDLDPRKALKVSMAITNGHKAEILVMYLSFFGWLLLSGLTMGILYVVYVGPYMELSMAGLYEALLDDALDSGAVTQSDLSGWSASRQQRYMED